MLPTPDYYAALLWKRFMGNTVLSAKIDGTNLYAYAHCNPTSPGEATVLVINANNQPASVSFAPDAPTCTFKTVFQVSAASLSSTTIQINGKDYQVNVDGTLPPLQGNRSLVLHPLQLGAYSYAFVQLENAGAFACY